MSEQKKAGRAPYPPELRERAVQMVLTTKTSIRRCRKPIESIAAKLSMNHETLRIWVAGPTPMKGSARASQPTSKASSKTQAEGQRAASGRITILKSAAAFFGFV